MTACEIVDRNKIPGPVMTSFDTASMDQAEVTKTAIAFARDYEPDAVLLSWFNRKDGSCGPQNICHEDSDFWLNYAITRGADLSVIVNDWDYIFVFKKSKTS